MSEAKYTKGPFTVHHRDGVSYIATNTKIADVYSTAFKDRANQEANANLLGASFDLLDALRNIENDDGRIPEPIWAMRNAAIAKAEGRS